MTSTVIDPDDCTIEYPAEHWARRRWELAGEASRSVDAAGGRVDGWTEIVQGGEAVPARGKSTWGPWTRRELTSVRAEVKRRAKEGRTPPTIAYEMVGLERVRQIEHDWTPPQLCGRLKPEDVQAGMARLEAMLSRRTRRK